MEAPSPAQVHDPNVAHKGFRDPGARLLMGGGEEKEVDAFALESGPGEGSQNGFVGVGKAGELGMEFGEGLGGLVGVEAAKEDRVRGSEARVMEEDAREFSAGVARNAGDRSAKGYR